MNCHCEAVFAEAISSCHEIASTEEHRLATLAPREAASAVSNLLWQREIATSGRAPSSQ